MIGHRLADLDPHLHPQSPAALVRLVVVAFSVVVVQAYVVDPSSLDPIDHLDLPLAVVAGLTVAHPARAATIALVFGLMVDALGQRLFGLHCVAYAALGPVVRFLPVPVGRPSVAVSAWVGGVQALVATAIVIVAQSVDARGLLPLSTVAARLTLTTLWTAALTGPVARLATPTGGRRR